MPEYESERDDEGGLGFITGMVLQEFAPIFLRGGGGTAVSPPRPPSAPRSYRPKF